MSCGDIDWESRGLCYCRIRDVLDPSITDQFMHLEIQDHFFEEFPDDVSLDQTVALWKHIVFYQKKWNNKI